MLLHELKIRMRSNRTAWIITTYLLIIGGVALTFIYMLTAWSQRYDPSETRFLFVMLSFLQLGMVCFFTPGLTSGVISGERERQTLSVLLTTNLTASKLILGKWLSSLAFMIFLVVTTIPLFGIVFLFGGISPWQILAVFSFYLITMLAIGSVGVLSSTLFKRTGIATIVTYGVVFVYTAGTAFLAVVIREIIRNQARVQGTSVSTADLFWSDVMAYLNPVIAMFSIFEEGRYFFGVLSTTHFPFEPYWLYFGFLALVTVCSLIYAIYLIQPVKRKLARK